MVDPHIAYSCCLTTNRIPYGDNEWSIQPISSLHHESSGTLRYRMVVDITIERPQEKWNLNFIVIAHHWDMNSILSDIQFMSTG